MCVWNCWKEAALVKCIGERDRERDSACVCIFGIVGRRL